MANAKNVYNIGIGTEVDTSGLEKGLSEVEKEVLRSSAKQLETIEKAAHEQIKVIQQAEAEKVAEVKKSVEEQIAAVKSTEGLDKAAMRERINAIKKAGNEEIKLLKNDAKNKEQLARNTAKAQVKQVQDSCKKQLEAVKDFSKKGVQAFKDFAAGAGKELLGLDQILESIAGGPAAWGKLAAGTAKKAMAALNEMAGMYREQEQAERSLQNAAKNNPYLSDRSVKQLISFANEMQRITGIDSVAITQTQTRLASLGRTQEQIQNIIKTAANMSASGLMDFDSAVSELNRSLNGVVGRGLGQLVPALKDLTAEELAAGKAMEYLSGKIGDSAAEAMKTGAGSATAFKNAVDNLKKTVGEGWEAVIRPVRDFFREVAEGANAALNNFKNLMSVIKTGKEIWEKELDAS